MSKTILVATAVFGLAAGMFASAVQPAGGHAKFARSEYNAPMVAESEFKASTFARNEHNPVVTADSEFHRSVFASRAPSHLALV